jgi:hypothetical protein
MRLFTLLKIKLPWNPLLAAGLSILCMHAYAIRLISTPKSLLQAQAAAALPLTK